MLIDTHTHLDFAQFHRRTDEVIQNASKAGIKKIINVGTTLQGSRDSIALADKHPEVYASVGIHPHDIIAADRSAMAELLVLAKHKKVVAIGEIGLDYLKKNVDKEKQKKSFIIQIGLAKRMNLPIIVHNREADEDVLEIIKIQDDDLRGVIHCFSSNWSQAQKFLNLGFYISFTGSITFKNKKAGMQDQIDNVRGCTALGDITEVIKKVPMDKILVETDSPFLAPEPYRGKNNEPAYVTEVAKKIAEIKEISFEEVSEKTTKNAIELFKFDNK
jgi:TatD DNase family protein